MAIIKRKTKKTLTKQIKKLMKKHGPEIAAGLIASLVSGLTTATAVKSENKNKSKKKKRKARAEDNGASAEPSADLPKKKKQEADFV